MASRSPETIGPGKAAHLVAGKRTGAERVALDELRARGCTCAWPAIVVTGISRDGGPPTFTSGHADDCALLRTAG